MNRPPGDFAEIVEAASREAQAPIAHPFGGPVPALAQGRGPRLQCRQTTQMFFCPRDLAAYDELCNRIWAGELSIRYEERTPLAKEGEVMILVCFFDAAPPGPPGAGAPANNGEEPEVRAHRIP